jgi:NNMT/PNMT/TEMT family
MNMSTTSAAQLDPQVTYQDRWNAKEYLQHYYAPTHVADDDLVIFRELVSFFKIKGRFYQSALEYGCGPTPHHAFPVIPHVGELHFADYLEENLQEIEAWLGGAKDAHNWDLWLGHTLFLETGRQPLLSEIRDRKEMLRTKTTAILKGDLRATPIVQGDRRYDLITSFFCVDAATTAKDEWFMFMKRLIGLAKPGADVFLVSCREAGHYSVGSKTFPEANVYAEDFLQVFHELPLVSDSIEVRSVPIQAWADSGFAGILIATARLL